MTIPKPDYPRPDRDRSDRWLPLNGEWGFETDEGATSITVPFAWETPASGVQRSWLEHGVYRREVPATDWPRTYLCFGGVHHHARVTLNGTLLGEHVGGSVPFEFEVTGLSGELVVEVTSPADKREIVHGKQRSIPRDDYDGVSFTPTSGIWQSVWLEGRGREEIRSVVVRGDSLTGFDVSGEADAAEVRIDGVPFPVVDGRFAARIDVTEPRLWSPQDPQLYEIEVSTADDHVVVTAGLRRIEVRGEQLYLNGERIYLRGVLDQGYWPSSGLTAPDDQALVADLELARDLGFTMVRKHIKLEEPRWLHYADRMGMLVWAEPPAPSRWTPASAEAFLAQLPTMVERDGNHPSIVVWGLYNEEWGLDWDIPGSPERAAAAVDAYEAMRALDATRPIVENSGWNHVRTDLVDWHYYDEDAESWAQNLADLASGEREDWPVKLGPDFIVDKSLYGSADFPRTGVPIVNSEYGAGFTSLERAWHSRWQTQELRRHDRFAGYVYTELTDVEHEMAGAVDADRRPKDAGGLDYASVHADTVLVVDVIPRHAGADIEVPDAPLAIDVHVSHHGPSPLAGVVHAAWGAAGSAFRTDAAPLASAPIAEVAPFALSEALTLEVPPPGAAARLHLWLTDAEGAVRARTFVDAAPIETPNRRGARPE
ncbi:glycoside hydrolase family 2 protein [Homoserinibacter sp. GY 40078]|uniref:glycoside hydrolase family 2 protein n=1 Tax=Homoserinibacter sp. GY 40078 TaxID=2603275 RepID=UPI0011CC0FF1|nr:glycoside hydrolase family 2 TIM barrel-domain containing protein [Homoserinibacter sp. GY 40078]TXK19511.1 glycoside hydrolase family 2 [Homoserinibacter sp. GY 40078]